jgi:hypothetical protein
MYKAKGNNFSGMKSPIRKSMNYKRSNDNIYKAGTVITAKENPHVKLVIMRYIHRTYYCAVVGGDTKNQLTYFEQELIAPSSSDVPGTNN